MADDIINAMPSAQGLNLGRANLSSQRPWMSNRRAGAAQQNTVVGAVAQLGMQIAGDAIDERRRQNFYEGQNRILNATLDGTQKEELQRIVSDEPWYAEVLGHGAMAKGAMEQAARSGAGKIFADWNSRLATGEDVQESPDVYKQKVMDFIKAQRTGDVDVDNAFLTSMMQTGQLLVQTQLQKHLEYNVQKTVQGVTEETYDVLKSTELAAKDERGALATFQEGMPDIIRGPAEQAAFLRAVQTFAPDDKPANLDINKWKDLKLQTALPLIEQGGTAIALAMDSAGFSKLFTPDERKKFDEARRKGQVSNDAHREREFLGDEIKLMQAIHNATSMEQVPALMQDARRIREQYARLEYSRESMPKHFRTEEDMRGWMEQSVRSVTAAEDKEERRAYALAESLRKERVRLNEINFRESVKLQQQGNMAMGVLKNMAAGFPGAPVQINNAGRVTSVLPSTADNQAAYSALKGALAQETNPKAQQYLLAQHGVTSLADAGRKLQVLDTEVRAQANLLSGERGAPSPSPGALSALQYLHDTAKTGDWHQVESLLPDPASKVAFRQFNKMVEGQASLEHAWKTSFGVPLGSGAAVKVSETQLDKAVTKATKGLSINERQKGWGREELRTQAKYYLDTGLATSLSKAVELATEDVSRGADRVRSETVLGVPPEERLAGKLRLSSQRDIDAAVTLYARDNLKLPGAFSVTYWGGVGHTIYPKKVDGSIDEDLPYPIDYEAARRAYVDHKTETSNTTVIQGLAGRKIDQ